MRDLFTIWSRGYWIFLISPACFFVGCAGHRDFNLEFRDGFPGPYLIGSVGDRNYSILIDSGMSMHCVISSHVARDLKISLTSQRGFAVLGNGEKSEYIFGSGSFVISQANLSVTVNNPIVDVKRGDEFIALGAGFLKDSKAILDISNKKITFYEK